ncbi:MAG: Rne/Rng family ribonuclease, partial [Alphaproteobacteria bacterium]
MKRMLIDGAHAEELRVAVVDGDRLDDFEIETSGKAQIKSNIYVAEISRVEPSLQAAFVTYGGNRNGFLAFGEVHPEFFAISAEEKEELLKELADIAERKRRVSEEEEAREEAMAAQKAAAAAEAEKLAEQRAAEKAANQAEASAEAMAEPVVGDDNPHLSEAAQDASAEVDMESRADSMANANTTAETLTVPVEAPVESAGHSSGDTAPEAAAAETTTAEGAVATPTEGGDKDKRNGRRGRFGRGGNRQGGRGGRHGGAEAAATGATDSAPTERKLPIHRRYKIEDVLKEGQKILVQVVKEERGSKGAALTTYFTLPGRYTVLMTNTPYAGGISRKVHDNQDRKELKKVYEALNVPADMGMIIRTAGVGQPVENIRRDFENLSNMWGNIRKEFQSDNKDIRCVHEDGSVIIRALRDMARDDLEEIVVSGKRAHTQAMEFAQSLMPEAVKIIQEYTDSTPLFTKYGIEEQLNRLHHSRVNLPSGGYMVIQPTEALVSVDINSGRATQERNIEETAYKTNLEAVEEVARQIRLRDLAGLIVIDFIDMEDHRNNRNIERAMRKVARKDRARLQVGNISDFGLMEISRQRLRPSFAESHYITCTHCNGTGLTHSLPSAALMILRRMEQEDAREADKLVITTSSDLIIHILNHKRGAIHDMEYNYRYQAIFKVGDYTSPDFRIDMISVRADGTESCKTAEMILREQPEDPPEVRYRKHNQRGRDDRNGNGGS